MFLLNCNFYYSLLGIETGGSSGKSGARGYCNFYYSLLGIETIALFTPYQQYSHCNFYYSLLGIETSSEILKKENGWIAISITPY